LLLFEAKALWNPIVPLEAYLAVSNLSTAVDLVEDISNNLCLDRLVASAFLVVIFLPAVELVLSSAVEAAAVDSEHCFSS
jgi:hypothetical protein